MGEVLEKLNVTLSKVLSDISESKKVQAQPLINDLKTVTYFHGASEETLGQFSDECLGSELMESLDRAMEDEIEMIRVMKKGGVLRNAHDWVRLLEQGEHEVVSVSQDHFGDEDFRRHLPALYLASTAAQFIRPFQNAVKSALSKRLSSSSFHLVRAPMKTFERIIDKADTYKDFEGRKDRSDAFACQFELDLIRCCFTVDSVSSMLMMLEAFRSLSLRSDDLELRRIKNLHHWVADAHPTKLRFVQFNVIFQHENRAMIGEVQVYFQKILDIKRAKELLKPYL